MRHSESIVRLCKFAYLEVCASVSLPVCPVISTWIGHDMKSDRDFSFQRNYKHFKAFSTLKHICVAAGLRFVAFQKVDSSAIYRIYADSWTG